MTTIYDILDAVPDIGDQLARELTIARMAFEAGQEQRVTQPPQQSSRPVKAVEPFAWCIESSNSADWCFSKTKAGAIHNASLMDDDCIQTEPFPLYKSPIVQPVAGPRVPMTNRQVYDVMSYLVTEPEPFEAAVSDAETWVEVMEMIRAIEAFHGIKPTSSEGPTLVTLPAAAVAEGAQLDGESLEQGE